MAAIAIATAIPRPPMTVRPGCFTSMRTPSRRSSERPLNRARPAGNLLLTQCLRRLDRQPAARGSERGGESDYHHEACDQRQQDYAFPDQRPATHRAVESGGDDEPRQHAGAELNA